MPKLPFPFSPGSVVNQEAGVWLSLPPGASLVTAVLVGTSEPATLLLSQLTVRRLGWSRELLAPHQPRSFPRDRGFVLEFPDPDDPRLLSTEDDRIWVAARVRRDGEGTAVIPFYLSLLCHVRGT
jgi:hypothetical protein